MEGHAQAGEIVGQHLRWKARLLLIQIDGDQIKVNRRSPLQNQENIKQPITILAAREAYHDPVAIGDHGIIRNSLPDLPAQARLQFLNLVGELADRRHDSLLFDSFTHGGRELIVPYSSEKSREILSMGC